MIRFSEGFPAEIGPPIDLHQFNMSLTNTEKAEKGQPRHTFPSRPAPPTS
jgi:hypothetical protein